MEDDLRLLSGKDLVAGYIQTNELSYVNVLFERYYKDLVGYVIKHFGSQLSSADIEEVVQESFIKIFRALDRFDPTGGNFNGWICKITWNVILSFLKKRISLLNLDEIDEMPSPTDSQEDETYLKFMYGEMLCVINGLEERYKSVLILSLSGFSEQQIAEQLNIPIGTVKSRLHRGCQTLQTLLRTKYVDR